MPRIAGYAKGSSRLGLKRPVPAKAEAVKRPDDLPKIAWTCLLFTLGVDCAVAVFLACGQFLMPSTFFGTAAAATLLAIGVANGWAFNSVRRAASTWARNSFIAQVFMLFLAAYVIVADLQSPRINRHVMSIAVLVLIVALIWVVVLAPRSRLEWTKAAIVVTALFPLAGLLQFWLQNYYLPSASMPLVDVSTELTPKGWSGPITHLSAKVTIHNRGTAQVNVTNSLMRVIAYPKNPEQLKQIIIHLNPCSATPDRAQPWCELANGFDPSSTGRDTDFRVNPALPDVITPTPPNGGQLLYASALHTAFLMPGETDTYERVVDIDSREVLLARLSASATFLTQQRIEDNRSCGGKQTSAYGDFAGYAWEVQQVQYDPSTHAHYFCQEYEIAAGNFIEKLIASRPAMRVSTWLDNPVHRDNVYPLIVAEFGLVGEFDRPHSSDLERKLEDMYPGSFMDSESEYAPTDKPPLSEAGGKN
jgi:hypothetical protein